MTFFSTIFFAGKARSLFQKAKIAVPITPTFTRK